MIEAAMESLIVGQSDAIRRLRRLILTLARGSSPVLIEGETGSGKELVAEALHRASGRRGPLVAVNICAIPESMFESTLFGHTRGAFTGAVQSSRGLIAESDGGTLFLDEIGSLQKVQQAKLLRVLETGTYRPVGGSRDLRSSFRLLTATNENVECLAQDGSFRLDLYYRLRGTRIVVPPLRERREDIPTLVTYFLHGIGTGKHLSKSAQKILLEHDWLGNVRELRQVILSAHDLAEDSEVSSADVLQILGTSLGGIPSIPERAEDREVLLTALRRTAWDTAQVAEEFGVHRGTIYRRMKRLGIRV